MGGSTIDERTWIIRNSIQVSPALCMSITLHDIDRKNFDLASETEGEEQRGFFTKQLTI